MNLLIIFLIAIALSMDAFSFSLSFGTLNLKYSKIVLLSLSVGIFHFFMPILGSILGSYFIEFLNIDISLLTGIIFLYIAIEMFKEFNNDEHEELKLNTFGVLTFALGVSLDSFGVGFTIYEDFNLLLLSSIIFSICSTLFTFAGLNIGKILNKIFGSYAILIGSLVMLGLAIINFVNFCSFD